MTILQMRTVLFIIRLCQSKIRTILIIIRHLPAIYFCYFISIKYPALMSNFNIFTGNANIFKVFFIIALTVFRSTSYWAE